MATRNRLRSQTPAPLTHEGAKAAKNVSLQDQLKRTVSACFLWEQSFYEDGEAVADRIKTLVHANEPDFVSKLAIDLRTKDGLRHAPLLMVRELLRHPKPFHAAATVSRVCQRPDDMCELLALYWAENDGKKTLSSQLKKGLADAFARFDEYQLAKWNRTKKEVTLKDIMRLTHPKPMHKEMADMWGRLVKDELTTPDTWETRLSSGEDKKTVFEDLIKRRKLGGLALLRNLRNMVDADVDRKLVKNAIESNPFNLVLPFRFIAAANAAPSYESELSQALVRAATTLPKLGGTTDILIDNSGSMSMKMSGKSDLRRIDAGIGLGILCANVCEDVRVWLFSNYLREIPARKDLGMIDSQKKHDMGGTDMEGALAGLSKNSSLDRLIVISDEQTWTKPVSHRHWQRTYLINLATYQNGVGYRQEGWTAHIDGFSEQVIRFINALEE